MDRKKLSRREALGVFAMAGGLTAAFGFLAGIAARFLMPRAEGSQLKELFIGRAESFPAGASRVFHDLRGGEVIVLRAKDGFKGFSNVCPHLGCHVHWVEEERVFFCPCHLGKFNADGAATAGPPVDAKQSLAKVEVRHDEKAGNLFLLVPGRT